MGSGDLLYQNPIEHSIEGCILCEYTYTPTYIVALHGLRGFILSESDRVQRGGGARTMRAHTCLIYIVFVHVLGGLNPKERSERGAYHAFTD